MLKGFDEQLADRLVERYRSLGIDVLTGAPVREVRRSGEGLLVVHGAGEHAADLVVHGAGRVADIAGLGLEEAGIEAGARGVRVDDRLRSVSDAHVWAAGDAADKGLPLTPVASREGKVVAAGILGEDAAYDGRAVPSVCFSDPPLAAVGMSTAEAARRGDAVKVLRADTSEWFSQRRVGQTHGGVALVTDAATGRLLGGHLLGVNADEVDQRPRPGDPPRPDRERSDGDDVELPDGDVRPALRPGLTPTATASTAIATTTPLRWGRILTWQQHVAHGSSSSTTTRWSAKA